jgi:hypothetical protein
MRLRAASENTLTGICGSHRAGMVGEGILAFVPGWPGVSHTSARMA